MEKRFITPRNAQSCFCQPKESEMFSSGNIIRVAVPSQVYASTFSPKEFFPLLGDVAGPINLIQCKLV